MIMALHPARAEDAGRAGSTPPAVGGQVRVKPGPDAPLDPLIFALARAVDRLGPGLPPDPRPEAAD